MLSSVAVTVPETVPAGSDRAKSTFGVSSPGLTVTSWDAGVTVKGPPSSVTA